MSELDIKAINLFITEIKLTMTLAKFFLINVNLCTSLKKPLTDLRNSTFKTHHVYIIILVHRFCSLCTTFTFIPRTLS